MSPEQEKEIEKIAERYIVRPYAFYWDRKVDSEEKFNKALESVSVHCRNLAVMIAAGLCQGVINEKEAEDIFYAFAESVREKRSLLYWYDNYDSDSSVLVREILLPEYGEEIGLFDRLSAAHPTASDNAADQSGSVGVWFSELQDTWDVGDFSREFPRGSGKRGKDMYHCFGGLPDGMHYGAYVFPPSYSYPSCTVILLVGPKGEMQHYTPAELERWNRTNTWPMAVAATPSGNCIVWITEGELWAWRMDQDDGQFSDGGGGPVKHFENRRVRDARMNSDGILDVVCEDGEIYRYDCDRDVFLSSGYRGEDHALNTSGSVPETDPEVSTGNIDTKLLDLAGVWFSQQDRPREERRFCYNFSPEREKDHEEVYRYYGEMPDGNCVGTYVFPSMISFADFRDPPFTGIVIVDKDGRMKTETPAEHMHLQPKEHWFPTAVASSPTGKTLVWVTEGELWIWHKDFRGEMFLTDEGEPETHFRGMKVADARMQADGILEVLLEDGETFGLFCDEDMFLLPFEGGWIAGDEAAKHNMGFPMSYWPESLILMITSEDIGWRHDSLGSNAFNECDVRRVCFEPGLETIKNGVLAMNTKLEKVVIPDHVKMVETFAFGCCDNLKELVIEGDISRVADWAEDAFDGCACEDYYKQIRNTYLYG